MSKCQKDIQVLRCGCYDSICQYTRESVVTATTPGCRPNKGMNASRSVISRVLKCKDQGHGYELRHASFATAFLLWFRGVREASWQLEEQHSETIILADTCGFMSKHLHYLLLFQNTDVRLKVPAYKV